MNKSFAFAAMLAIFASSANADTIVVPVPNGGIETTKTMDMDKITLTGNSLSVKSTSYSGAVLEPLPAGYAFDPTATYYTALNGKAYNYEYGWSSSTSSLAALPSGDAIWIELVSETAGLQTYYGSYSYSPHDYSQIFATNGSIWEYGTGSSGMQHNTYAVLNPTQSSYTADYLVYVGDATTDAPVAGYNTVDVTWTWTATPVSVPEPSTIVLGGVALAAVGFYCGRRRLSVRKGAVRRPQL
jgi:hypothetical protein